MKTGTPPLYHVLIVESDDSLLFSIRAFLTERERREATRLLLDGWEPDVQQQVLDHLEENGIVEFEGDPPLRWMTATAFQVVEPGGELHDFRDGETRGKTTSGNALPSVAHAAKRIEEPAETACGFECPLPHPDPGPPPFVKIDSRLLHRIGVREWGLPSMRIPGKIWRSEKHATITCMLAHPTDPDRVRIETLPLWVVEIGEDQWMPDAWRVALWEYVQAWPSSGCEYGPFLALPEGQRCDFIRTMAAQLVASDNIGCRHLAHDIGMFAALEYELPEPN